MRGSARKLVSAAAFSIAMLVAGFASATDVVIIVDGGGGEKLAAAIAKELPDGVKRVDPKAVTKAAKKEKLPATKALDGTKTKGPYMKKLGAVIDDVKADGALIVRVTTTGKGKKKNRIAKVIVATPTGTTNFDQSVFLNTNSVGEDAAAIRNATASDINALGSNKPAPEKAPPTAGATPPPPAGEKTPPPAGEKKPPEEAPPLVAESKPEEGAKADPTKPPGEVEPILPQTVDAMIALELASRHFKYNDSLSPALRPYDVDLQPNPAVALELYPLARANTPVLRDIGLVGDFHTAIGLKSKTPDGNEISTTWSRIDAGVRFRYRFKAVERPPAVGLTVSYGQETFSFHDDQSPLKGELPTVAYKLFRGRLDGRIPLGPVAVLAGAAYISPTSSGESANRVRGHKTAGVEFDAGLALGLGKRFELRAGADYRRFFYSFNPLPGDPLVAGGALDEFLRFSAGIAFTW